MILDEVDRFECQGESMEDPNLTSGIHSSSYSTSFYTPIRSPLTAPITTTCNITTCKKSWHILGYRNTSSHTMIANKQMNTWYICIALDTWKLQKNDYLKLLYLLTKLCASSQFYNLHACKRPAFCKTSQDHKTVKWSL